MSFSITNIGWKVWDRGWSSSTTTPAGLSASPPSGSDSGKAFDEGAVERIDHVGSTSVPGMAAKPIVDIQVSVASFDPAERYDEPLSALGYEHRSDDEPRHRFYKRERDGRTLFHLHVCETGKDWESDHLLFREFLKAHPLIAEKYGEMKREAASHHAEHRERYTATKEPHLEGLMKAARRWFASSTVHGP
jgi:GrpB-like predicted nucleotidyltransferase (UPF0157 family)